MKRSLLPLLLLIALVVLPIAARERPPEPNSAEEVLVILSPHNEAIRFEFEQGFRAHMRKQGRRVRIDWRTPGGTGEITRYLISEYLAAFEHYWTHRLERPWSSEVAVAFADARVDAARSPLAQEARRAFLASNVGCGVDLLFGGGTFDFAIHAAAGRLVDSGITRTHPELFGPEGIPEGYGGMRYRDAAGRWIGTCLTGFGICLNRDALARHGFASLPSEWSSLAHPKFFGRVALADPTMSGSVAKAFEMLVQEQMVAARERAEAGGVGYPAELDRIAREQGWDSAMRLIRRIAGNARYFSDSSSKIVLDVAMGDAMAGMCSDFYGRFQSEVIEESSGSARMTFVLPERGTAFDADPIGLLRGAPHSALAVEFMHFVLSEPGQQLWSFKRGVSGGPVRHALRRLPILKAAYAPQYRALRSDPDVNPYSDQSLEYREAWTGDLLGAIAFVVRVMCVDSKSELEQALSALIESGFPPLATALFDDVSLVSYAQVSGPVRSALRSPRAMREVELVNHMVEAHRAQYRRVAELARERK